MPDPGGGSEGSACRSRAGGSGQGAGVRALPAVGLSPDSPDARWHLAAGTPEQAAALAGHPPRRAAPADPEWLPESAEPSRSSIYLQPCEAPLSLHQERPFNLSAPQNLSPRTGSCTLQVLSSRSAFGEKKQKFGARLPWLESTTYRLPERFSTHGAREPARTTIPEFQ